MATLEERLAQKAQAGAAPAAAPTAAPDAPLSLEDRLRQKTLAPAIKPPPAMGGVPPHPVDTPGIGLKSAWEQINPVAAVQGLMNARQQIQAEREEFARTHPSVIEQQLHEGMTGLKVAGGMVKGLFYDLPKQIGTDIGERRYWKAGGTVVGTVAPLLVGAGVKKLLPATPKLPKGAAGLQKAEQAFTDVRAGLPTVAPEALQTQTGEAAQRALTGAYRTRQGLQESARLAARAKYSDYEKALTHPKNVAPPGLELRPAEFVTDAEGNQVMSKPALRTTTPFNSPVETAPFRAELEQLIEHDQRSPFPAGHPIRKFLDSLGVEKPGVTTAGPEPALAKGYQYVQFDDLKKALGKLSVYADPKGGLRDPYQGLAQQIISKAHPVLESKLKDIARESKIPIKNVVASMEQGDQEWAKYKAAFKKLPPELSKAKSAYELEEASRPGKSPGYQPITGISSVSDAAKELEPIRIRAGMAAKVSKAAQEKATSDWTKHLVSNPTNLDMFTQIAGPQHLPELLGNVLDDIKNTKDYGRWSKLDPNVVQRLTAHQPDLGNSITSVLSQLEEAQTKYGAQATQGALSRAVSAIQATHGSRIGRTLMPKAVTVPADLLSVFLQRQDSARRLNQALRTQVARIPLSTRVVRAGATVGQAAPIAGRAAAIPPPPEPTKMAGEQ